MTELSDLWVDWQEMALRAEKAEREREVWEGIADQLATALAQWDIAERPRDCAALAAYHAEKGTP